MIFIGEPNHYVRFSNKTVIRLTNKRGFYFDENGKYETYNDLLIRVLKQHFPCEENNVPDAKYKCKKCDYITDNKPELMKHYKIEHPKEGAK